MAPVNMLNGSLSRRNKLDDMRYSQPKHPQIPDFNMSKFRPHHDCVNNVFGMFRYSVCRRDFRWFFRGGGMGLQSLIDLNVPAPSPSKKLRT